MSIPTLNSSWSQDTIWLMLQYIPAHDRETWVTIGMAVKSEYGDDGFTLFDNWSQRSDNYNVSAVKSVWCSFKGGAVSIGSLVHLAKEHGWRSGSIGHTSTPKLFKSPPKTLNSTRAYGLRLWRAANKEDTTVSGHLYAMNKGIGWAAGARRGIASGLIIGKNEDCVIVPIRAIDTNKVQGVQCINSEGRKQTFGCVSGGGLILGNTLDLTLPWYVCEGWASAVSMVFHHHKGNAVCAASFGKHNQAGVAKRMAQVYSAEEIIILEEVDDYRT